MSTKKCKAYFSTLIISLSLSSFVYGLTPEVIDKRTNELYASMSQLGILPAYTTLNQFTLQDEGIYLVLYFYEVLRLQCRCIFDPSWFTCLPCQVIGRVDSSFTENEPISMSFVEPESEESSVAAEPEVQRTQIWQWLKRPAIPKADEEPVCSSQEAKDQNTSYEDSDLNYEKASSQDNRSLDKDDSSLMKDENQTSKRQKAFLEQLVDPKTKSTKQVFTEFFKKVRHRSSQHPKKAYSPLYLP